MGLISSNIHNETGGAGNYLCLPLTPGYNTTMPDLTTGDTGTIGAVQFADSEGEMMILECSVCYVSRPAVVMLPAVISCPVNWRLEYLGFLMSQSTSSQTRTEFICVDTVLHQSPLTCIDGCNPAGQLFPVQAQCETGLGCTQYQNEENLSCVVCSRNA